MTWVAVAAVLAVVVTSAAWAGLVRSLIRQQARERMLLLDQLMHLAGRTWTPPPAADTPAPDEDEMLNYGLAGPVGLSDY